MANALLSPSAKQQFTNADGTLASNGTLYTCASGTTTPATTYSDRLGLVQNANPIVLDARGECVIYLPAGVNFRYVLKNALGVTQWTKDDVIAQAGDASAVFFTQVGTGAIERSVQDKSGERLSLLDFIDPQYHAAIFAGTSTFDAAPRIQKAIDASTGLFATGKPIDGLGLRYSIRSAIDIKSYTHLRNAIFDIDKNATLGALSVGGGARVIYTQAVVNDITLENVTFQSTKTSLPASLPTVALQGVTRLKVDRCVFKDFGDATHYAQGLAIFNSAVVHVTRSEFRNCSGDGLGISSACRDLFIDHNIFESNGDWGCALTYFCDHGTVSHNIFRNNVSSATGADRCVNLTFVGNFMDTNEHGVRVCKFAVGVQDPCNITVTGNTVINCTTGVAVEDTHAGGTVTVGNNALKGCGKSVHVVNSQDVTVTGNSLYNTTSEAILFEANSAQSCGKAVVSGNNINGCTYGIRQITSGGGTALRIAIGANEINAASVANEALLVSSKTPIAPTLAGTWVNFGGSERVAGYRLDAEGVVHIEGLVKSGTVPSVIFTLPAGYRPAAQEYFASVGNGAFAYFTVDSSGNVTAQAGNNTFFSLKASFRAG